MRFPLAIAAVVVVASVVVASACPPPPPPVETPECGVTSIEQAIAVPPPASIQFVLEGGDVCTPGAGDECAEEFDACDVDVGDVAVASVRRETLFVRAVNSPVTLFDAHIRGDCPDVYIEGFFPGTFVGVGFATSLTLVVNATLTGPCAAQLVLETDAVNAPDTNAATGFPSVAIDVLANRVEGGAEGCSASVACCCDFALTRLPAQCDDDERLTCLADTTLLFTDQCDAVCGEQQSFAWAQPEPDALLLGPVPVGDTGDVVVVHPTPCTVERWTRDGIPVWATPIAALDTCDDVALAGAVLVITGDGDEVLVNVSSGDEGATRENDGRTLVAAARNGAITVSRRADDLVVRNLNSIGAVTTTFDVVGVQPDAASPHFVAALDNGDVVVSFVRAAGTPAVELPAVGGGTFALGDADYTALLQLDDTGLVRRAFVVQSSVVAHVDARGNAYVMCGGTQGDGALVELGALGEPAAALGSFSADRGFLVLVDAAGNASLDVDAASNLSGVCGFDDVGDLFVLATSNTALTLRSSSVIREVALGRAVAVGALLDGNDLVMVAIHGGIADQLVVPLYPVFASAITSGSFVMRAPRSDLGL